MVRAIAGTLMAVGRKECPASWVREVLEARDRTRGGVTASASGLYLVGVRYPESFDLPQEARLPVYG
jgi:tRNA pseudouridine38-40 synthase